MKLKIEPIYKSINMKKKNLISRKFKVDVSTSPDDILTFHNNKQKFCEVTKALIKLLC